MKPETTAYLLSVLNSQYAHIAEQARTSKAAGERQRHYYNGMRSMFEAVISEGYTDDSRMLSVSAEGVHFIVDRSQIEQSAGTEPAAAPAKPDLLTVAIERGFTGADFARLSVKRIRPSVTQGYAAICVDGTEVLNFADEMFLRCKDGTFSNGFRTLDPADVPFFGYEVSGYGSMHTDEDFLRAAIAHLLDSFYHYSDMLRKALSR